MPDPDALLREAQAIRQEDDALVAWLRERTIALHARVRELQEELDRLRPAADTDTEET